MDSFEKTYSKTGMTITHPSGHVDFVPVTQIIENISTTQSQIAQDQTIVAEMLEDLNNINNSEE